ncbi:hypothetical protein Tco_0250935 [Tanacetum coccineum]
MDNIADPLMIGLKAESSIETPHLRKCGEVTVNIEKTNTIVTTPVNVTGAPVTNTVANHAEKPEKFNGQNFKRWQQKMFFYLGTLNLAWFLNETAPQLRMERTNLGNSPTANIRGKGDVIHIWKRV